MLATTELNERFSAPVVNEPKRYNKFSRQLKLLLAVRAREGRSEMSSAIVFLITASEAKLVM
jgi:hypothetical protein